jgi:hypothetical protein
MPEFVNPFSGTVLGGDRRGGVLLAASARCASIVPGQDTNVGYTGPAESRQELSISESLAVRIRQPGAICILEKRPSRAGRLQPMGGANVAAHVSMRGRAGMGRGTAIGLGRGAERGTGPGRGAPVAGGAGPMAPEQASQASPEPELAKLGETLKELREQLAKTMERIEELEKEG